ncbi:hypothetical protein Tco_0454259 [Tanacetum coccineum]
MHTMRRDGVKGIKRRRRDLYGDGVRNLVTASGRGRLKEDLESSTWRRRQDFKATSSQRFSLFTIKPKIRVLYTHARVTYSIEVEKTLSSMEVPSFDEPEPQLEDLGLNTCNHDLPLSSMEVPSFDEPEPQPQPLPNRPPLDVSLGNKRGLEPPIKPHSLDSFRLNVVEQLTIYIPPSPQMAYYHPSLGDPKKHYGFKPGLLGNGRSLGVDFSKLEMIEYDFFRE